MKEAIVSRLALVRRLWGRGGTAEEIEPEAPEASPETGAPSGAAADALRWLVTHESELAQTENGWVAVSGNEGIVARGRSMDEVLEKTAGRTGVHLTHFGHEPRVAF